MEKILKYVAVLLVGALVFGAARFLDSGPWVEVEEKESTASAESLYTEFETEAAAETQTEAVQQKVLLTFAGDCTLGCRLTHAYNNVGFIKVVGEDYQYPFRNVAEYFAEDDLTLVNLEGALCSTEESMGGENSFRGLPEYVNILTQGSVEAVSLANDHVMDCGQKGYDATKRNLEEAGISYVERDNSTVITLENGVTVGLYGAVYYLLDTNAITEGIRALKEQADIVVFAPHWGLQKNYTAAEDQIALAHAAIDAGADIVFGTHPGVLQPVENYNGGVIYYSLGSFCYGGNIYPEDYDSAMIRQEVILEADGTVTLGETTAVPVAISARTDRNDYQIVPYAEGSAEYGRVLGKLGLGAE